MGKEFTKSGSNKKATRQRNREVGTGMNGEPAWNKIKHDPAWNKIKRVVLPLKRLINIVCSQHLREHSVEDLLNL